MKILYDDCLEAIRDNKCSECNDYFQCTVCDYIGQRYEKGRADYEAECQKIFEDNPPMHFNHEQIMWLKEFVKIRCNQARADAIDEMLSKIHTTWLFRGNDAKAYREEIDYIAQQLKEQNK